MCCVTGLSHTSKRAVTEEYGVRMFLRLGTFRLVQSFSHLGILLPLTYHKQLEDACSGKRREKSIWTKRR